MRHLQKKSVSQESSQGLPSNDIGHLVLAVDLTAPLHDLGSQSIPTSMIGNPYVVASARGPAPVPRRVSSTTDQQHSQDWATFTSTSRALSRRGTQHRLEQQQSIVPPDPSMMALEMIMSRSAGQQQHHQYQHQQQRESRYRYNPATQINSNGQQQQHQAQVIVSEMELDAPMSHTSSGGRPSSQGGRWARAIASRRGLNLPEVRDGVHVTLIPGSAGFPTTNMTGGPGTSHFPRRGSQFSTSSSASNGNTTLGERTIYRLQRSRSSAAARIE